VVLLFGGLSTSSQSSVIADDWIWNGINSNWSVVSGTAPSARFGHSMAQLAFSNRVIMFGGSTNSFSNLLGDTWQFDATTGWSQLSVTGPIARYEHRMASDTNRGVIVLFGGYGGSAYKNDTWEFNGTSWSNRTPTSGNPNSRYAQAMAFDQGRGVTVMFGGYNAASPTGAFNDTWEWDGSVWTQRFPANSPPARDLASMTYDPNRGLIVLFGGAPGLNDEWTWDGTNWTQQTATRPSARQGAMMDFDPYSYTPLLFGGIPTASGTPMQDTWMRY
jgi:N-acetylneuraminic acid mutarotase